MNNIRFVLSGTLKNVKPKRHSFHSQQFKAAEQQKQLQGIKTKRKRFPFVKATLGGALASFISYDGVMNEFTYCGASIRFLRSLKAASLIAFDYLLLEIREKNNNYNELLLAVHQKSANRLLETCLLNGGLYIKVGQGCASINHILPIEYTRTLAALQDKCFQTTREDVQKVFLTDFGQMPEKIFQEFDYAPVAAASLAQVFKGKLKTGEDVAIKVQYSDLKKRFNSDLGTIIFLQDVIELFFKDYHFGWILRGVQKNLVQELNFVAEAENSEKCASQLKKFEFVHVPNVYWDVTKTRVLTMEWIDGFKISDVDQIKKNKFNISDIDTKLFKMFSEQIFCTGFVHADPHPGNIFVRKNPESSKIQLVLLDHGLYEVLPRHVRLALSEFWEATVLRDERKMAEAAKKIQISDYMKFAEVLFQQPIRMHGGRIKTKLTETDIAYMQEVARKNFDLIMSTLKDMPRNMLFVVRNLNTVRAIGRHHGDVVDRPHIMARHAQRSAYSDNQTMVGYMRFLYRRVIFEYSYWRNTFNLKFLNLYLNILHMLGRAPKSAKTLVKDLLLQQHPDNGLS